MKPQPRRTFLALASAAGAVLWLPARAQLQPYPRLDEADPRAFNVGYVEDASRADVQRFPKYAPGEVCSGCELYQALPTQPWAPCTLFPKRVVAGRGWCDAYRARRLVK